MGAMCPSLVNNTVKNQKSLSKEKVSNATRGGELTKPSWTEKGGGKGNRAETNARRGEKNMCLSEKTAVGNQGKKSQKRDSGR